VSKSSDTSFGVIVLTKGITRSSKTFALSKNPSNRQPLIVTRTCGFMSVIVEPKVKKWYDKVDAIDFGSWEIITRSNVSVG
jgi:hypothetical protein